MSYRGVLNWGFMACPEAIPRLWHLAAAVPRALDDLLAATGQAPAEFRSQSAAAAARSAGVGNGPSGP